MGIGELAGLSAAACWASASLLYSRTKLSAWGMNLGKNVIASLVLFVQLWLMSSWQGEAVFHADLEAWLWLGWSGVFGIVIGDTFYFRSLQILGPRRALMVSTTAPIFGAVFGLVFLGEALSLLVLTGVTLTTSAVIYVVAERTTVSESPGLFPGSTTKGVLAGVGGAVCQALGGVCSRIGMSGCDGVEGAFIRLSVSAIGVSMVIMYQRQLLDVGRKLFDATLLRKFVPAVLLGTWLGIWLSQVAYKHSSVSVATTLLATTPLFAVPLVRIIYGHTITWRAVAGTFIAVLGVCLIVA